MIAKMSTFHQQLEKQFTVLSDHCNRRRKLDLLAKERLEVSSTIDNAKDFNGVLIDINAIQSDPGCHDQSTCSRNQFVASRPGIRKTFEYLAARENSLDNGRCAFDAVILFYKVT